ncbi:hypothetical protein [Haloimpatiens massiliensis]|uniref:hypothetical protein n=1 Tax=Haloimpatiens massiliensis TaxID=1658110 RepID=UPI0015E126EF|nr:hypothetical protein [Haloimpatiens massiliensis]
MFLKKVKKKIGLILACTGAGIVLAVIVPIWGWLILVGGGLIYCGWFLTKHCD